jgi:heme/copper-type cytochrome/quinol oxidase subunit 4
MNNSIIIRKIASGVFASIIIHVGLWFFLDMYENSGEIYRNLILLAISFLIWVLSISGYVLMVSKNN